MVLPLALESQLCALCSSCELETQVVSACGAACKAGATAVCSPVSEHSGEVCRLHGTWQGQRWDLNQV